MNVNEAISALIGKPVCEIPVNISTIINDLTLCYIEYEDEEKLVVNVTGEDGKERLNIVFKKYIVNIGVVYEDDIQISGHRIDYDPMVL